MRLVQAHPLPEGWIVADVRSRGTALPAAAVGEPDALLATKVSIPRVRRDVVSRPRLVERLDEQAAHKLLVVCTPAGFGKTTLLAGWAHGARWPVAWLSLDAHDNDPARFWGYVVAALDRVRPGIGEPVLALFAGPTRRCRWRGCAPGPRPRRPAEVGLGLGVGDPQGAGRHRRRVAPSWCRLVLLVGLAKRCQRAASAAAPSTASAPSAHGSVP
jgi:hypothetical protein